MEFVRTGDIVPYDSSTDASDILLMMGGSSNHVVTVLSCILSFVYAFPNSPLLYIDFGVTAQERCWLEYVFRMIHTLHEKRNASVPIYYRTVDWDHFPDWIHITKALNHGGYAWKPIVIADAFYQWKGVVMWNDAGNYFRETCMGGIIAMRKEGIFMPFDHARLDQKFHTDTYNFLIQHHFAKPFNRAITSGRAIYMLFDYHNSVCRDRIMIPWVQCAYTRRCMTLKGAAKTSHLPEQGVLSILMRENITLSLSRYMNFFPYIWRDKKEHWTVIPNSQLQSDMELYSETNRRKYSQQQMLAGCPVLREE